MLNEDEAEAEVKDEGEAKDEAKAEEEDEETGAADGAATATGRSRRTGHAITVLKRGTSNRPARFENELPRLATKTP